MSRPPWYETRVTFDFDEYPKVRQVADCPRIQRLAEAALSTRVDGKALGCHTTFDCNDLYDLARTPGHHVLVSPTSSGHYEIASLLAMNDKGVGSYAAVVIVVDEIQSQRMESIVAELCLRKVRVIEEDKLAEVFEDVSQRRLSPSVYCMSGVSRHLVRPLMKAVQKWTMMSANHADDIPWLEDLGIKHVAYYDQKTETSIGDVLYKGSKEAIVRSLVWRWDADVRSLSKKRKRLEPSTAHLINKYRCWKSNVIGKLETEACPICLEEKAGRSKIVMSCCCSVYCAGCVEKWVSAQKDKTAYPTCPNCRAVVDASTMNLVLPCGGHAAPRPAIP